MDTAKAWANGAANAGREKMVFDWVKAANVIKARGALKAGAGLRDDWEWTGGEILSDGKPVDGDDTYLASTWAVPELEIDGELIECFVMQSSRPKWDSHTRWPEEALEILKGETKA